MVPNDVLVPSLTSSNVLDYIQSFVRGVNNYGVYSDPLHPKETNRGAKASSSFFEQVAVSSKWWWTLHMRTDKIEHPQPEADRESQSLAKYAENML